MNWLERITAGEGKTLEFKRALPSHAQIARTVVAFANTSGGHILIGVADDGSLVGVDESSVLDMQDAIVSSLADTVSPTCAPDVYSVRVQGVLLVVVEVSRGALLPYALKKQGGTQQGGTQNVYIRIGASNRVADAPYIAELTRQRSHIGFDEELCMELPLSQLYGQSGMFALEQRFAKAGKPLDNSALHNLRLMKTADSTEYPTNGLLILLGYFDHVRTQCARFKGSNMDVFSDRKEYTGDVLGQLEQTLAFVKNHLNLRSEIQGLQRTDTLEIPEAALREALVNAYVHRDYSNTGRNIKVGIYDDKVHIISPGGLPPALTIADVSGGRSEVRNRVVARVFKETSA